MGMMGRTLQRRLISIASFLALVYRAVAIEKDDYVFALIPKTMSSIFFTDAEMGCKDRAEELGNVTCWYIGPEKEDLSGQKQVQIIRNLTAAGDVDGIAISVINASAVEESIKEAINAGIPVVTFDSDAPDSGRLAYLGTNNMAFGDRLGKVLQKIAPRGGTYALVSGTAPNIVLRERGVRLALTRSLWKELDDGSSPIDPRGNSTLGLEKMAMLRASHPDLGAIVPVLGSPMRADGWKDFVNANRNLTLVVGDALPNQMELLNRDYVNGLVGQLPYEMGELAMTTLLELQSPGAEIDTEILGTALVEVLRIPLNLPPVDVDNNYIGNLRVLGYVLFSGVALLSISLAVWTQVHRDNRVVKASQPQFLLLICVGSLIFGSSIIPLGIDDERTSLKGCSIACMSMVWLATIGFVLVYSALFSKTWRVNRIFHNPNRFQRIKVTAKDVIVPLVGLLTANIVVLICWTVLSPLQYVRIAQQGTDPWNRVISTYGACQDTTNRKGGSVPYLVSLAVIDFGALIIANFQVYQARNIQTEYSESKYIAFAMTSMLQTVVIGVPVFVLVEGNPRAEYGLMVLMIFLLTMAILLLMFIPKIRAFKKRRAEQAEKEARKAAENALTRRPSQEPNVDDGSKGLTVSLKRKHPQNVEIPQDNEPSVDDGAKGLAISIVKKCPEEHPQIAEISQNAEQNVDDESE